MAAHGRSTPTPTRWYPAACRCYKPLLSPSPPFTCFLLLAPHPPSLPAPCLRSLLFLTPHPHPFSPSLAPSLSSAVFLLQLFPSRRPSSSSSPPPVLRRKAPRFQVAMDRKNMNGSQPAFPSPVPPSESYGAKGSSSSSPTRNPSSGLFNSVFPPTASLSQLDRKDSPKSDIFGPPRKLGNPSWNATHNTSEEGKYGYNSDKEHKVVGKEKNSIYQSERTGPCSLSNSLYYGGQDICVQSPKTSYSSKNDDEDDPASSHFASRGNWWQGSLYY